MSAPSVLCFNTKGSEISDAEIERQMKAIQVQLTRDLCPAWNTPFPVLRFGLHSSLRPGEWALGWFATSDVKGALGFHELTPDGLPLGEVLVVTTRENGGQVSVTASHEAGEMTLDPFLNRFVKTRYKGKDCLFPVEAFDPPEDDRFAYKIGDVLVSDFTLPAYWRQAPKGPYTFRSTIKKPLPALGHGGYLVYSTPDGSKHEITARLGYNGHRGTRSARRRMPRQEWRRTPREVFCG